MKRDGEIRLLLDQRSRGRKQKVWKTIKYEHVYLHAYASVSEARAKLTTYIEFYNRRRPHSALDRQTPDTAYFILQPLTAAA